MWAIPTGTSWLLKKKNQVKSPSPESRVPETGSDPPIGSDRDSGRDIYIYICTYFWVFSSSWTKNEKKNIFLIK